MQDVQYQQSLGLVAMTLPINPARQEMLTFGLEGFGLVNCDYFFNNPPANLLAMNQTLLDENNTLIEVPKIVRNIIFTGNSYLASSSQQIPFYGNGKSLVLFANGPEELIVIRPTLDNFSARRLNIKGKSPAEVKQMILHE